MVGFTYLNIDTKMYAKSQKDIMEALLGKGTWRGHMTPPNKIDPIDPAVAGTLRIDLLLEKISDWGFGWTVTLEKVIRPKAADVDISTPRKNRWCGINLEEIGGTGMGQNTKSGLETIVKELLGSILEQAESRYSYVVKSNLFLVPKTEDLSRIILDCRALNAACERPPKLLFATIKEIFMILGFFMRSYTATGDFRHWFYQIPLDKFIRNFFRVSCNDIDARLKVWAMGFAWSPFVAQACSMAIGKLAIEMSGQFAINPGIQEDTPPPFWIISSNNKDAGSLTKDDVVGFLLFWYDNLFITTGSNTLTGLLTHNLKRVTEGLGAVWKAGKDTQLFCHGRDTLQFLGMDFVRTNGIWLWKHIAENTSAWLRILQETDTWRKAVRLAGILTWDWCISGRDKSLMRPVFDISRKIGRKQLEGGAWLAPAPRNDRGITQQEWRTLYTRLKTIHTRDFHSYEGNVNYMCDSTVCISEQ